MFFLVVSGALFVAFLISFAREQRRLRNGVLLFAALLVLGLGLLFTYLDAPGADTSVVSEVLGWTFLLAVFLALPVALVANGVVMLRREGRRLGNLLSLLAGVAILALVAVLWLSGVGVLPDWADHGVTALVAVAVYLALAFVAYVGYSLVYARLPRSVDVDFIVVHGSRLIGSRVPPLLASRLDRARRALAAADAEGADPLVVTSGGKGSDEDVSEASAMAEYLVAAGVPAERILREDRSTTTRENLVNSKAIMTERLPDHRCLLVTNDYHAFRTALLARAVRVNGHVLSAPTAWYYVPSATIREFIGILRDHWRLNAVLIAAVLVVVLHPW